MNKKCVLITGASSGLGANLTELFAQNGYNIVMTYLSHEVEANNIKNELTKKYDSNIIIAKCDITKEEDIINLKNIVLNEFGIIDILINNAGISIDTPFEMKNKDNFMKILETNLVGTFLMSKHFGDIMYDNKNGSIINISSTNGIDTYYEYGLDYDASKAGIINLTHNLANHYAPYVRVNTVCPGWIDTPMNKNMDPEFRKKEVNKILLNRFANPSEISNLVLFLASDESSYINDSIIRIDGGKKC